MKKNWMIAGILGAVAAVIYFASLANYAFPGESAHLMAVWQGLDATAETEYPLMAFFCRHLGGGNLIAPICGVLSVMLIYAIVSFFVAKACVSEKVAPRAKELSRVAGVVSALVFMLTPGVREAATHLEPRMFDTCWVLVIFALMIPYLESALPTALFSVLIGALMALGYCDSAVIVAVSPLVLMEIVFVEWKRGNKPYLPLTLFTASFLIVFFVSALWVFDLELQTFLKASSDELKGYCKTDSWLFVAIFATLPFIISLFSSVRTFGDRPGLVQWFFHGAMTFVTILAVATRLSPSDLLRPEGITPVLTSAYVAIVAGYLASFWWLNRRQAVGAVAGVVFAFVLLFTLCWNLFTFDGKRGAFADEVARKILADLGGRTWFVTDGVLDDHLLLQDKLLRAKDKNRKPLHIINLRRDSDEYLAYLGKIVEEEGVGGSKNGELALSLKLGVLPFVQDWFAADPSVAEEVAIFGAPDLWYSAGLKPVPEFLFFGADERRVPDWSAWKQFDKLLEAPKGWGSYRSFRTVKTSRTDPVESMRHSLRRHLGFVANNRGVWLQDEKKDDEAFALYELVLNEIDKDNVCTLFNEMGMAHQKYPKAVAKQRELDRRIKAIADDKDRRYEILRLGLVYGYIRDPDMFVRLGFAWARSGRPGDALAQIRRAVDFVPDEKRTTLLNMMAALYASGNAQAKSRQIYESILQKDAGNHDALIGMMRIKLMEGDQKSALAYLERAVKASSSDGRGAQIELSMVAMMKNDLEGAKAILHKLTAADSKDLQAWGLLAALTMQQWDATKDKATKDKLIADIRDRILPEMERHSTNPYDYYIQTTKAFLLMRQGEAKRREAREALVVASRERPDIAVTRDLVLGLDISLNDRESAKRHARETLLRNRNAPLANYVMGSQAISEGKYDEAERYLRRAVDTPQPTVLALNDLAEVLRRTKRYSEAETFIRKAIEKSPNFFTLHQTLGEIIMDSGKNLEEAEACIRKAIELAKDVKGGDVRLYATLARVQIMRGDKKGARSSIRRVETKINELSDFEKKEFEEIKKSAK